MQDGIMSVGIHRLPSSVSACVGGGGGEKEHVCLCKM